ncbi:glutamate transport system substrate-binding protein [Friedmanniella endophytica]|uniref:Glutamate transport system substrate-binding protein n=1 Tax=Microlunatus kandeliicorticis TaxID=1759536 RepID=A0A7W3IV50_9ACTN|nr:glutamate ABC transporter substrate-binding protein [Microlunatus kandeliicorticis]MBA8795821.1 glutamate transport system substrate-binding protein [Microlunatus kandeliicorticis]
MSDAILPSFGRRKALGYGLGALGVAVGLSACSGGKTSEKLSGGSSSSNNAFDDLIANGETGDASVISASAWASKIKSAGTLRWGGTDAGPLFSLLDPTTGKIRGFDAGIVQLLAKYIIGEPKFALTQTTVDTRETLIQNGSVDVVVATYSITPERAKKVNFAGPYYASGTAIMVMADNNDITKVEDLVGKKVITESNSTAILALQQKVPSVKPILFTENAQCVAALKQGRGDAFVLDQSILLSTAVKDNTVKVVGEPFSTDDYGIGCTRESDDAKNFINAWLKKMEAAGTWKKLHDLTVGTVLKSNSQPPAIAS